MHDFIRTRRRRDDNFGYDYSDASKETDLEGDVITNRVITPRQETAFSWSLY